MFSKDLYWRHVKTRACLGKSEDILASFNVIWSAFDLDMTKTLSFGKELILSKASPTRVAQWRACRTHDLVFVSLIPGWDDFSLAYICLSPPQKHLRKVAALERKIVLILMWESQETHMRHWPPWCDLSCYSGVKSQYDQPKIPIGPSNQCSQAGLYFLYVYAIIPL